LKPKKTTITILILTLLILLPQIYAYIYPPHINPETAPEEEGPPVSLLLTYALGNLTAENWTETLEQINNMEHLHIPPNYKYILTRTIELLRELTNTLKQINDNLEAVNKSIEYGQLENAKTKLNKTELLIEEANTTIIELETAINQLIQTFKLPSTPLERKLNETKNLLNQYLQTYNSLKQTLEEILWKIQQGILIQPNLTITTNTTETLVGSTIKIYGNLTAGNTPLPNKTITIYLNNQPYIFVKINETGIFTIALKLPKIYTPTITIYASYKPEENDTQQYLPTTSNIIEIKLIYYTPTITILNAPEKIKPTIKYIIEGKIEINNTPLPNWPLTITFLKNSTTIRSNNQGYFNFTITITTEPQTPTINIILTSQPRNSIGPATTKITIPIEYLDPQITVKIPKTVIAGIKFEIYGTVETSDGPVKNGTITIKVGPKIIDTNTNENGTFTIRITVPITTLSKKIIVTILLTPKEFWINTKIIERQVIVINPLTIILPLIPILIPLIDTLHRKRKERYLLPVEIKEEVIETITLEPIKQVEVKLRHPIVALYWKAVEKIYSKTGTYPQPSQTLREYFTQIKEKIKGISEKFEKLTTLTEKALYAEKVTKQDEKLAKELYKNILKEIKP